MGLQEDCGKVLPNSPKEKDCYYPIINFGRLRSVQRLCQMRGLDLNTPCQGCDGACEF